MKIYRNVLYWSVFGTVTIGGAMYVWGTEGEDDQRKRAESLVSDAVFRRVLFCQRRGVNTRLPWPCTSPLACRSAASRRPHRPCPARLTALP